MRVLRLGLGDGQVLDLHPSTSVVTDLTDHQRDALQRSFTAIGTGLAPDVPGLLEAHGLLLDATQEDLDLLGVPESPVGTVVSTTELLGAVPAEDAERLRTADRDLVLLATDRWHACDALARAEAAAARPTRAALRARQAELRARIARHAARQAEPVRVALDGVRDRQRTGTTADAGPVAEALADVGLDVRDLGLPVAEAVRLAEDWLGEREQEAARVVGAGVELRAIEQALLVPGDDLDVAATDLDELRRRAQRSVDAHAHAVDAAAELRRDLERRHDPRPTTDEVERHLSTRLVDHRPDRLAGSAPMLLDGVLDHLDDRELAGLLDRIVQLAGSVQVVVLDPRDAAQEWAEAAGHRHAAVVTPSSRPVPGAPVSPADAARAQPYDPPEHHPRRDTTCP